MRHEVLKGLRPAGSLTRSNMALIDLRRLSLSNLADTNGRLALRHVTKTRLEWLEPRATDYGLTR